MTHSNMRLSTTCFACIVSVLASLPIVRAQGCPDVYEPNDDCATATVLAGPSFHDTIFLSQAGPSLDVDHFRVTVPFGSAIEALAVGAIHPAPVVWCEILAGDCGTVLASNFGSPFPSIVTWANGGQSRDVVVRFTIAAFVCDSAVVSIEVTATPCAALGLDRFEPNDVATAAVAVPNGAIRRLTATIGDVDYFVVPAPRGSVVVLETVETALPGAVTSVSAALENAGTGHVYLAADVPGHAAINLSSSDSLLVRASSPTCARYAFATTVIPTPCTGVGQDAFEPNDDLGEATFLHRGEWSGMTIEVQDDDWFEVVLQPGELFIADASWDPTRFAGVELRAFQSLNGTMRLVGFDDAGVGVAAVAVRNEGASVASTWLQLVQRIPGGIGVAVNGPSSFCTQYTLTARYRQVSLGQVVCAGTADPGEPATDIDLVGSPFAAEGRLRAIAHRSVTGLPWHTPRLNVGSALDPHITAGVELCVGGAIRFEVNPSHVFTGSDRVEVDALGGTANPGASVLAGSTWVFQFSRHESAFGAPEWSSDAVSLLLR